VLGAGWVERNAGKDEVRSGDLKRLLRVLMSWRTSRGHGFGKPLESCRNEEKDHEASGLRVDRAEAAEVCRGIIKRPD
jgi:hypothetical protein